jgi:3-phenylpropionate/cinnamic acid dioxygenase small subunit
MGTPRDEITELIYTYAERIDAGDFEGIADLFAHAEITSEGFDTLTTGRDAVLAMYTASTRRYPDDGTPKTKHVMTNVIVEADEAAGTATSRSYFTVLQAVPGQLALQPIIAGRYHDRFERVDGRWRFSAVHFFVDLVGDLSAHMLYDISGGPQVD